VWEGERVTDAELAILGLVYEQERHGYQIEQVIRERGMREWTAVGFSSIYYLLSKLEKRGLIGYRLEWAGRGAPRKVYRITAEGEIDFHSQVMERLSESRPSLSPFLLGLANAGWLPRDELIAALGAFRQHLASRVGRVKAKRAAQREAGLPRLADALFDYSLAMGRAQDEWIEGLIMKLEEEG
jgi:DNA-binding PadR family transcriptional regulator